MYYWSQLSKNFWAVRGDMRGKRPGDPIVVTRKDGTDEVLTIRRLLSPGEVGTAIMCARGTPPVRRPLEEQ